MLRSDLLSLVTTQNCRVSLMLPSEQRLEAGEEQRSRTVKKFTVRVSVQGLQNEAFIPIERYQSFSQIVV